jgi:hemerythrin superfamily protein
MGKGPQVWQSEVGKGPQTHTTEMGPGYVPQSHTTEVGKGPQMHTTEMGKGSQMHTTEMGKGPQMHTTEMGKGSQMHTTEMGKGSQMYTTEMGKGMHPQVTPQKTGGMLYSIRNDHTLLRSNIDSLFNLTDLKTKLGIFNDTIKCCSQYDVAEEVVLYSTIRNLGLSQVADTALEQTKNIEKLLYDMDHKYGGGITDLNTFNEDLTRLREALNLHINLEENEIFPSLESYLCSDDIDSINKWFDRIKAMAPTRPHPGGPHSTAGKLLTGPVLSFVDRFRDLSKQFTKTP